MVGGSCECQSHGVTIGQWRHVFESGGDGGRAYALVCAHSMRVPMWVTVSTCVPVCVIVCVPCAYRVRTNQLPCAYACVYPCIHRAYEKKKHTNTWRIHVCGPRLRPTPLPQLRGCRDAAMWTLVYVCLCVFVCVSLPLPPSLPPSLPLLYGCSEATSLVCVEIERETERARAREGEGEGERASEQARECERERKEDQCH